MLPALGRLRLSRTGEFYPLSDSEVNRFAEEERQDPITLEDFQTDDGDTWRTFRVRSETPGADGEYTHFYYSAAALWRHYNSATHVVDPLTRQPIWYEDWVALHDAYAPSDSMRLWVYSLPTRDPGTVKAQPPPPMQRFRAPPPANQQPIRRMPHVAHAHMGAPAAKPAAALRRGSGVASACTRSATGPGSASVGCCSSTIRASSTRCGMPWTTPSEPARRSRSSWIAWPPARPTPMACARCRPGANCMGGGGWPSACSARWMRRGRGGRAGRGGRRRERRLRPAARWTASCAPERHAPQRGVSTVGI